MGTHKRPAIPGKHRRPGAPVRVAATTAIAVTGTAAAGVIIAGAAGGHHATPPVILPAAVPAADTTAPSQISISRIEAIGRQPKIVTVQPGDTLSELAGTYCGNPGDWTYVYTQNEKTIGSDPNLIEIGQKLDIVCTENSTMADITVKAPKITVRNTALGGTLSCSGLESLWEQAGGNPGSAFLAAEIAMAESGGNQYAVSPTSDYGYWQINASHGPAQATFNALGNAEAAIAISGNGSDWSPWVTFQENLYEGRC